MDSVWIPFDELRDRLFELPHPFEVLNVANNCDKAEEAGEFLRAGGRSVVLENCFETSISTERNRLWSPNPWVEQVVSGLPVGTVLDIGCGSGRDLVFLGDLGWKGLGVDHLPSAVQHGRLLATRYRVNSVEFAASVPMKRFDLCVLMFVPIQELLPLAVAPSVVLEGFTARNFEKHGKPARKFQVSLDDLEGFEIVKLDEGWRESGSHTLRAHVRRK